MSLSQREVTRLRESIDRLTRAVESPAYQQQPAVRGLDEPVLYAGVPKVVTFPNKQDNTSSEFQIGRGDNQFNFVTGRVDYIDSASGKPKEYNMKHLEVARSLMVAVDQPVSIDIPGWGRFAMKGDDQLLAEHLNLANILVTASRDNTGIRLIACDMPTLPVELAKTVNARRIAGFDGKTFRQELTAALSANFAPNKEFASLEVEVAFDSAYTGTWTLTKVSRLGSAYNVRRLAATLTAATDAYWAPEPEWDFQKGDSLTVALTAQAGVTASGELVTDDR